MLRGYKYNQLVINNINIITQLKYIYYFYCPEKLFKENNPKDAVQVLENEILNGQISANTYNFLGLGYYQIGEYEKSVDAFGRGIKEQPANAKILYFNQGNAYYALKQFEKAAECFSLSYKSDLSFVDALLNRANSYLMDDKLVLAKNDYVDYLEKFPETPQKSKIELLINAITDEIERRKEEERLLEEQNKALWEHINPNITEYDDENKVEWELIDDEIADVQEKKENMNWQEVGDNRIGEIEIPENKKNWEEIDSENAQVGKIDEQTRILEQVSVDEKTDKTVAFFFVTSNGLVQVRQSSDYVPKMIELAGGKYIFEDLGDPDSRRSTVNMQVEEFYNGARNADYLIYNSSIDGGVSNVEELLDKCELLADFKAVKEGNVWCTTNDLYQQSLSTGYLIGDIHAMVIYAVVWFVLWNQIQLVVGQLAMAWILLYQ